MGRTIGDVLRCSSSAVTPVLLNAQPDRSGIAHRFRPLGGRIGEHRVEIAHRQFN
jgi:hypothetical protein